jgi:hypothetical protein
MQKLLLAAIASLGFAGCYTHGDVGMGATYSSGNGYYASGGGGYYANPQLYYYGPGVSVVAYSDDPVFYSDGYYWRYYGGTWYSSSYYGGGWTLAYNVPYGVRTIRQPTSYARFQPGQGWTRVNASGGAYTGGAPVVRDHRTGYNPPAARTYQAPATSNTRDHRSAPVYSPPASSSSTRDHRTSSPAPSAPARGNGPTVRDHRKH